MHRDRRIHRSPQCTGNWFAHIGVDQNEAEATTSSAQNQVQNNKTAPYTEEKLLLAGTAQEQTAVKNNFPFSFHDNKHCLQNVGEYFDFGLGRRKVEPERRQQNSQNFLQWADKPAPSKEDGLTIYQTSFMKGGRRNTQRSTQPKGSPVDGAAVNFSITHRNSSLGRSHGENFVKILQHVDVKLSDSRM